MSNSNAYAFKKSTSKMTFYPQKEINSGSAAGSAVDFFLRAFFKPTLLFSSPPRNPLFRHRVPVYLIGTKQKTYQK